MNGQSLSLAQEVPLIGQPLLVQAFSIVVTAACQCQRPNVPIQLIFQQTALGLQATPGVCPSCQIVYAVTSLQMRNGVLLFDFQRSGGGGGSVIAQ